jgi:hypothetical protein
MRTIASIQTLRAFAALAVVAVHSLHDAGEYSGVKEIGEIGGLGQIGVDIFFVISGFIMYTMVRAKDLNPRGFIIDRVSRVWPIYIICSVLLLALALAGKSVQVPTLYDFMLSLLLIPHAAAETHPSIPWRRLDAELRDFLLFPARLFSIHEAMACVRNDYRASDVHHPRLIFASESSGGKDILRSVIAGIRCRPCDRCSLVAGLPVAEVIGCALYRYLDIVNYDIREAGS